MRALLLVLLLALAPAAQAVDNTTHVLGLGAVSQFATGDGARPAQLSAKFALQPRVEASILFGLRTGSSTAVVPGAKFAFVLVPEKNMNLYAAVSMSLDLRTASGLEAFLYQVGPGVELFHPDFPHLGFALEFGLGGTVLAGHEGGPNALSTAVTGLGAAGVHYYF